MILCIFCLMAYLSAPANSMLTAQRAAANPASAYPKDQKFI
jgi:hypothetical protein